MKYDDALKTFDNAEATEEGGTLVVRRKGSAERSREPARVPTLLRSEAFVALTADGVLAASAVLTLTSMRSMAGGMQMPGGWTMSMTWMPSAPENARECSVSFRRGDRAEIPILHLSTDTTSYETVCLSSTS